MLSFSFWRQFAEIENVIAIKIAPFNRYQTIDVVRAVTEAGRRDIALYTRNDDNILLDLITPYQFPVATGAGVAPAVTGISPANSPMPERRAAGRREAFPQTVERRIVGALSDRGLFFESARSFAGPRRLTVAIGSSCFITTAVPQQLAFSSRPFIKQQIQRLMDRVQLPSSAKPMVLASIAPKTRSILLNV